MRDCLYSSRKIAKKQVFKIEVLVEDEKTILLVAAIEIWVILRM